MSDFANKINNRRKELGLSYEEVYARVLQHKWSPGVDPPSESTVGNWLGGLRRPRHMKHLTALCNALDLSLGEAVKDDCRRVNLAEGGARPDGRAGPGRTRDCKRDGEEVKTQ